MSLGLPSSHPPGWKRRPTARVRSAPAAAADLPRLRRLFSTDEYYRMAAIGLFDGQRVELIEGEVLRMSPQLAPHAASVTRINRIFTRAAGRGVAVRVQLPLAIDDTTEPEPDIAVVRGRDTELARRHPSTAVLVIEVSETSLEYDRTTKARLYAKAGVADYWIVDLVHRRLEIRRQPAATPDGHGYAQLSTLRGAKSCARLAFRE